MRLLVAVAALLSVGCMDITFTAQAPCSVVVEQHPFSDTVYRMTVDSLTCPRVGR